MKAVVATAAETLEHLKKIDPEVETVQTLYVVDGEGHLAGAVNLRKLLAVPPEKKIAEVMDRRMASVHPDAPQEEVAKLVSKYDVFAIPVVDGENRPLGIVTSDDVIDILIEEQTEDLLHLGGVTADKEAESHYFGTPVWRTVRKRIIWLIFLFGASTATGLVLRHFEGHLTKVVALAFFIPLLIGTGGNGDDLGVQSSDHLGRGCGRRDDRIPGWSLHPAHAQFHQRRHLRGDRRACGARYCQRYDTFGAHV